MPIWGPKWCWWSEPTVYSTQNSAPKSKLLLDHVWEVERAAGSDLPWLRPLGSHHLRPLLYISTSSSPKQAEAGCSSGYGKDTKSSEWRGGRGGGWGGWWGWGRSLWGLVARAAGEEGESCTDLRQVEFSLWNFNFVWNFNVTSILQYLQRLHSFQRGDYWASGQKHFPLRSRASPSLLQKC